MICRAIIRLLMLLAVFSALTGKRAQAAELSRTQLDAKFERYMQALDLEQLGDYQLFFKTGGTSIGFKIARRGGKKRAVFLPRNSSHHLEEEVVAYRLSRLLGVSNIFNPADYFVLGPKAIAKFRSMLRANEKNKWRKKNTNRLIARIRKEPNRLNGTIRYRHKRKSQSVDQLIRSGRLNRAHKLAKFLRGSGPRPGNRRMRLKRIRPDKPHHPQPGESETVLARQLSTIFLMDMLTGQWDRFSGGNIEAYAHKDGRLQFVSRDNGGADFDSGWKWFGRYAKWVTRFDRSFVSQLQQLHNFLSGCSDAYNGFSDPAYLKKALGFLSDRSFQAFKRRLNRLVSKHIPNAEERYSEDAYF